MAINVRTSGIRKSTTIITFILFCQIILVSVVFHGIAQNYASSIDVVNYKKVMNSSLPFIDCIYNSGKVNFSFVWEFRNITSSLTGVDTNNPLSILNLKSPSLSNYYPIFLSNQDQIEDDLPPVTKPSDIDYTGEKYIVHRSAENNALSISYELGDDYHVESSIEYSENNISYAKGTVVIKNGSCLNIDIEKIIKEPFYNKFVGTSGPQILIYHTHTTEGYITKLTDLHNDNVTSFSTSNDRNVVRAGHELDKLLTEKYGFETIHNSSQHHYPSSQAYNNSLKTIKNIIQGNPSIKLTIDIHRDGLAKGQGKLRLVQKVNGKDCAKIMFVVGTDETSMNPRWHDNLRLAILLQERLETIAPGICRHISIRSGRYNQHVAENGLLIELGGDGNTIDEVKESCKYLADAINYVLGEK